VSKYIYISEEYYRSKGVKYISLKTLDVLFSNGITFVLNNLFYISQIDYLDAHASLIN
jgi:hypothetical protein